MKTVEEIREYAKNISNEELLKEYKTSCKWMDDPFKYSDFFADQGLTVELIEETYEIEKAEILNRMEVK